MRNFHCGFLRYECRVLDKQHTHVSFTLRAVGLTVERDASDWLGRASSLLRGPYSDRSSAIEPFRHLGFFVQNVITVMLMGTRANQRLGSVVVFAQTLLLALWLLPKSPLK